MYKEIIISAIILVCIFGLDYITQKNTDDTVNVLSEKLETIRQEVIQENPNKEKATTHINDVYEKWEELDDKMAYYIEHDELEKVSTALTSIRSFVKIEEYGDAIESIDKCVYILDHIHERERFTLDNIF